MGLGEPTQACDQIAEVGYTLKWKLYRGSVEPFVDAADMNGLGHQLWRVSGFLVRAAAPDLGPGRTPAPITVRM